MIRTIIEINEEKCSGCGLCAAACHEGAIEMIRGKARLTRDDYCDGLGNCLPVCPTGAISFIKREAAAYDEAAVLERQKEQENAVTTGSLLAQWPVQIKLAPCRAPYFQNADLLIAADCAAYSYADFHKDFMRGKITLIGCPKLDEGDYSEKLTKILRENAVRSLCAVRMEVPCCGGIERAAAAAVKNSGRNIPFHVVTLSTKGKILTSAASPDR